MEVANDEDKGDELEPILLYSVPSLGIDDSKGPPTFVFVTYEIPLSEFPYSFPEDAGFFITNGWLGRPDKHRQDIKIFDPKGALLVETGERILDIVDSKPYMAITYFMGLTFKQPGQYSVKIYLNEDELLTYPLFITQAPAENDDKV